MECAQVENSLVYFYCEKLNDNKFNVYLIKDKSKLFGRFKFKHSKLFVFLNSSKEEIVFVHRTISAKMPKMFHYENLNILNKSLMYRGISVLQRILMEDLLGCFCKKW